MPTDYRSGYKNYSDDERARMIAAGYDTSLGRLAEPGKGSLRDLKRREGQMAPKMKPYEPDTSTWLPELGAGPPKGKDI